MSVVALRLTVMLAHRSFPPENVLILREGRVDTSGADEPATKIMRLKSRGKAFEAIIELAYVAIVKSGDMVIDGGAHRGRHTFPMARCVGPDGLVLAFEPIPLLAEQLRSRLAAEQIGNTRLIEAALSHTGGTANFTYVTNIPGYSGLLPRDYPSEPVIENITVKSVLMDDYISSDRPLSFVKLDLEGGEFRALQGGSRIMREKRPLIAFENGTAKPAEAYGYSAADFFGLFESADYQLFDMFGRPFGPLLWGAKGIASNFLAVARENVDEIQGELHGIVSSVAKQFGEAEV